MPRRERSSHAGCSFSHRRKSIRDDSEALERKESSRSKPHNRSRSRRSDMRRSKKTMPLEDGRVGRIDSSRSKNSSRPASLASKRTKSRLSKRKSFPTTTSVSSKDSVFVCAKARSALRSRLRSRSRDQTSKVRSRPVDNCNKRALSRSRSTVACDKASGLNIKHQSKKCSSPRRSNSPVLVFLEDDVAPLSQTAMWTYDWKLEPVKIYINVPKSCLQRQKHARDKRVHFNKMKEVNYF